MLVVTCAQMRQMEKNAESCGISSLRLMENAGSAAARYIRESDKVAGKRCLILCGQGNNGGDGFVVARKLLEHGADVSVILVSGAPKTQEAQEMLERLSTRQRVVYDTSDLSVSENLIRSSDIIVDAVYGTGFHGTIADETTKKLFDTANASSAKIYALDMPSGANADSGEASDSTIRADVTIAFAAPKIGQFLFPAANYCGKVVFVGIGLPESAYNTDGSHVELLDKEMIARKIPLREKNSNKGTYGKVLCVCGSLGMAGAAYMCAGGALRCGAGLVTLAVPKSIYVPVASKLNECMVYPLDANESGTLAFSALGRIKEMTKGATALVVGCGLSQNEETQQLVRSLVSEANCPVILDADGINAFAGHIDLLRTSKAELILTPHPGEMSRLCGKKIDEIQQSRLDTARSFAMENGVTLVLKGANTVIASKDGHAYINPTGNPGMAKGGSGDILAGMIASFAAQGISPVDSACCGAFIHGLAGDMAAEKLSEYGMIPTDMIMEVPQIFRDMSR